MLLDEWKKERWNFYLLWRFSPRRNSKLNSICLDFDKRWQQTKKKDNIQHFCFCFVFVFATETWAKRASTRLRGGSASDRHWRDRLQRERKQADVHCWRACVCVHECVCSKRVNGQLVKHIPWDKALSACSLGKCTNAVWTGKGKKKTKKTKN